MSIVTKNLSLTNTTISSTSSSHTNVLPNHNASRFIAAAIVFDSVCPVSLLSSSWLGLALSLCSSVNFAIAFKCSFQYKSIIEGYVHKVNIINFYSCSAVHCSWQEALTPFVSFAHDKQQPKDTSEKIIHCQVTGSNVAFGERPWAKTLYMRLIEYIYLLEPPSLHQGNKIHFVLFILCATRGTNSGKCHYLSNNRTKCSFLYKSTIEG